MSVQLQNTESDPMRPSDRQLNQALSLSESQWLPYTANTNMEQAAVPGCCFRVDKPLIHVPAMPDEQHLPQAKRLKKSLESNELVVVGGSSWKITGSEECGLGGNIKETESCSITLGVKKPTSVTNGEESNYPNKAMVTAIFAAVAYIFSKRLIELQGHGDGSSLSVGCAYYTEHVAPVFELDGPGATSRADVYVGEIDDDATRWWQAMLAQGTGWVVGFTDKTANQFLAPWAIKLEGEISLVRKKSIKSHESEAGLPSASRAKEYLLDFCRLHGAENEFSAAVAMASMLPTHNLYRQPVKFQWSQFYFLPPEGIELLDLQFERFWELLAQNITLSCHSRGMLSNLCGAFWEPNISCNVVHVWLHPLCEILPNMTGNNGNSKDAYYQAILAAYATRSPQFSCYALGAVLTGLLPLVIHFVKSGLPMIDLGAAAWSGCKQSFIQDPGSEQPSSSDSMLRADVWRLLYLAGEHLTPPLSPWKPFGEMRAEDIPLEARIHCQCARTHFLSYRNWAWQLVDGSVLVDCAEIESSWIQMQSHMPDSPALRLDGYSSLGKLEETASKIATANVFRWVTVNGDGYSPNERDIYEHNWVGANRSFSDCSSAHESGTNHMPVPRREDIQRWISQTQLHSAN